jgi:hypothetical protein
MMSDINVTNLVEFLRFGSSIPGDYWGCCAGDIIQCFKSMPDEPASCQSVNGDGGYPQQNANGEDLFFGMTNRELFMSRFRVGTFGTGDMQDHFFMLVLEDHQLNSEIGRAWLPILKECGFEFVRTLNNSVWGKINHIFMLVRNITGEVTDPFTPPKAWTALPSNGKTELHEYICGAPDGAPISAQELAVQYKAVDQAVWNKVGPAKYYTRAEVEAAGVPVILAGMRSDNPQEYASTREERNAAKVASGEKKQEVSLKAPIASIPVL